MKGITIDIQLQRNYQLFIEIYDIEARRRYFNRHLEGVVMGQMESEQVYLKEGDSVTVRIEELGKLTNQFVRN